MKKLFLKRKDKEEEREKAIKKRLDEIVKCVCVCVCVRERERKSESEREREREFMLEDQRVREGMCARE